MLTLKQIIEESNNIVFFGGAGVSVESNIPDFRSADGLYNLNHYISPEEILSHNFFYSNTEEFFNFYKSKMLYPNALPNPAHLFLTKLEKQGKLKAIITQNIDGLHQLAKSDNVLELHGSVHRNYCVKCGQFHDLNYIISSNGVPKCKKCGGIVKPDVVLYQEALDENILIKSINAISNADCLIVGGTSLTVYPAAGLVRYFNGKYLVIINKSITNIDKLAHLVINDNIGKVFKELDNE